MNEREAKIRNYAYDVTKQLNSKYPGIVTEESLSAFLGDLFSSQYSDDEKRMKIDTMVDQVVANYAKRVTREEAVRSERHYDLNDMFDCRITRDTLHIHVVPKSVKEEMTRMGVRKYLEFCDGKLMDAFGKIANIINLDENNNIRNVFAVSPLIRINPVQELFKKYGFDVGMTESEKFMEMFGTRRIGEAIITREKFLNMVEDRKLVSTVMEEESGTLEVPFQLTVGNELEEMITEDGERKDMQSIEKKTDSKVFVKTNGQTANSGTLNNVASGDSNESGYGSVLGVVFVIVSISFILAGLFIGILS